MEVYDHPNYNPIMDILMLVSTVVSVERDRDTEKGTDDMHKIVKNSEVIIELFDSMIVSKDFRILFIFNLPIHPLPLPTYPS